MKTKPATALFNECLPDAFIVLGRQLKPFCLGHYLLLKKFGCAFVQDIEQASTIKDLVLAVWVCSQDYAAAIRKIEADKPIGWREKLILLILAAARKIRLRDAVGLCKLTQIGYECLLWGLAIGPEKLNDEAKQFIEYLDYHTATPSYWIKEESMKRSSGAHWAHALQHTLMTEMNYTEAEVLRMPLQIALLHYYRIAEANGLLELMTPEEFDEVTHDN